MKIYLISLLSFLLAFSLVSCNAVKGAGEDMQQGGKKNSRVAKDQGAK